MRIFINNCDSYVGQALCADLRQVGDQNNRLVCSLADEGEHNKNTREELLKQMDVKRVVSRKDMKKFVADVLSCSLIVYDMHSAAVDEVEMILKELKLAKLGSSVTFILVSSVNVWAKTHKKRVPKKKGEDEEEEEEEEEEEGAPPKVIVTQPEDLKDTDMHRRLPSAPHEAWKSLETLALSLNPKEKLRAHVVAAGILYGNGEMVFNELFKSGWLARRTHAVLEPGDNYVPCIHVRDVARLVKDIAGDVEAGHYHIAVDKGRHTQAELVNGIVGQMMMTNGEEVPILPSSEAIARVGADDAFRDAMSLDLIFEPSSLMTGKGFSWWCGDGFIKNLDKVAAEFCKWRNLRPVRISIIGPPGSGVERFCSMVADRYLHNDPPNINVEEVWAAALQEDGEEGSAQARLKERYPTVEKLKEPKGLKSRSRILRKHLLSNVCRYRGYILDNYPRSYEEAQALFTEKILEEGEEAVADEEPEEEEVEEPPPEGDEEEEEDVDPKKLVKVNDKVAPEFVTLLSSATEQCKARIFDGVARGAHSEEEFDSLTASWAKNNLAKDGTPGTSEFYEEFASTKVLQVDVDKSDPAEAFHHIRVYMETRGMFFNYLEPSEEKLAKRQAEIAKKEQAAAEKLEDVRKDRKSREDAERAKCSGEEASRSRTIAEGEAQLLETQSLPLRQYLMQYTVPTLSEGLSEVCKVMPDDPIEYLAEYLFAHAQDIQPPNAENRDLSDF